MAIVKICKRDCPFAQIDKRTLADQSLSYRARGILAYLLTKPDDWVISVDQLVRQSPDGDHCVREAIKELKARGYLFARQERDLSGKIAGWTYTVYERPQTPAPKTDQMDLPLSEPQLGNETQEGELAGSSSISQFSRSGKSRSGLSTSGKSDPTNIEGTDIGVKKDRSRACEESDQVGEYTPPETEGQSEPPEHPADAELRKEAERHQETRRPFTPPLTQEEARTLADMRGISHEIADAWWRYWEGRGWMMTPQIMMSNPGAMLDGYAKDNPHPYRKRRGGKPEAMKAPSGFEVEEF